MRVAPVNQKFTRLVKYSIVALNLLALGCASAPNLLYVGSDQILEYPLVRKAVAEQDYPIVVTRRTDPSRVLIRWTDRGDWVWWETTPFTKASKVQFRLFKPGTNDVLCESGKMPNSAEKYDCVLNTTVRDYMTRPLVGELNYWFKNDPGPDDLPNVVMRTYYLME